MLVACVTHPSEVEKVGGLADLIEYRLDHFDDLDSLPPSPLPLIFTFRKKEQGGVRDISEKERLNQIEKLLENEPAYCDIEADTDPAFLARIAQKFPKTKLIGSYHNFKETPRDLEGILASMKNPHFSIYKIAVTAKSTPDMLRLMTFAGQSNLALSVISMGEWGRPSRVLGPVVGNVLNYAGLEEDPQLGRYSLRTLHEIFHYRKLNRETLIYGLIGDPVEQSPGDLYHNARFKRNAVYVKIKLDRDQVREFFQLCKKLPFGGLSVTRPLKEAVFQEMDQIEPFAQAMGAINTITFHDRKAIGTNTDGPGALNALKKYVDVQGKVFAILGAGGTARAIGYEAKKRGAIVAFYNRTPARAKELAAEFGCAGYGLDKLHTYDILVNTTPPQNATLPPLYPNKIVMDVVYSPKETPLLIEARKRGCRCVYGEEMFVEQADLQQKEWALGFEEFVSVDHIGD